MNLIQLSSKCYATLPEQATDRPALGYVAGSKWALQIDSGNSPAHLKAFRDAAGKIGLATPKLIALTHSHWDHTYGMCAAGEPVVCSEATGRVLQKMSNWAWNLPAMEQRVQSGEDILFCHEHILAEYKDTEDIRVQCADVLFRDRLTLDLGDVHAELIPLTNSHAEDCTVIYIPEEQVVYLGDITYEDLHHKPVCYHAQRFAALTDALRKLDFRIAVPGHQSPMSRAELFQDLDCMIEESEKAGMLILND